MNRRIAVAVLAAVGTFRGGAGHPTDASQVRSEPLRPAAVMEVPTTLPPLTSLEVAVKDAYAREYAEPIFRPAIFNPLAGDCARAHLTTTAYLKSSPSTARLVYLYMTPDGTAVTHKAQVASVLAPAGRLRMLTVIVRHPATFGTSGFGLWRRAQHKINQDHASFASSRDLAGPIVSFDNTNLMVEPNEIADPHSFPSVREAVGRKGLITSEYHIIASINLDPRRLEGGFAAAVPFVYMGNYSKWARPLTGAEWINVANAVYHHEVAHHWGWAHDWATRCRGQAAYGPFIAPPVLFGWEDVDGDGVPEILDSTPYGRSQ